MKNKKKYTAVVIGVSAGGVEALSKILPALPKDFFIPIIIVHHIGKNSEGMEEDFFGHRCKIRVVEASDKEEIKAGTVFFAPTDYHLMVEDKKTLTLNVDPYVNHSRPSIDVLFESAAKVFKSSLIGIVMTGASSDGSYGLKMIKEADGLTIVQNPDKAKMSYMPESALKLTKIDHILDLDGIIQFLLKIHKKNKQRNFKL